MKKNILLGALSVPLFLIAGFFWLLSSLPDQAIGYVSGSVDSMAVMAKLRFRGLIDAPGFVGIPGSPTAKGAAGDAIHDEQQAWGQMSFIEMRLTSKQYLTQCVQRLHDQRLEFYNHIMNLPDDGLLQLSDGRLLVVQQKALTENTALCNDLAVRAQKWRERLLAKVTGSSIVEDDLHMPEQAVARLSAIDQTVNKATQERPRPAMPAPITGSATVPVRAVFHDHIDPSDTCKQELKQFFLDVTHQFNAGQEQEVNKRCDAQREQWICYLKQAKNRPGYRGYGGLSMADEGHVREGCGLPTEEFSHPL